MMSMRTLWMSAMPLVLLAGAALPAAARADTLNELDVCTMRLEPEFDVGFVRITARCPELARDIQSSDWAAWLPEGWNAADNSLSARSLAALRMLVVRERDLRSSKNKLDVAQLRAILAEFAAPDRPPQGWWARLQNWLREVLARSERDQGTSSFARVVGHISLSEAVLAVASYGTFALVVLLAGYIVVNEWRIAGMRRRPSRAAVAHNAATLAPQLLSWDVIERAALPERPRMLLQLLAARLTATRRLPAATALTARELARGAQLADTQDQERLAEVAAASERLLFSDEAPEPASLIAVMRRGRELLERLNAAEVVA
jgi:hypothetical protein